MPGRDGMPWATFALLRRAECPGLLLLLLRRDGMPWATFASAQERWDAMGYFCFCSGEMGCHGFAQKTKVARGVTQSSPWCGGWDAMGATFRGNKTHTTVTRAFFLILTLLNCTYWYFKFHYCF